MTQPAPEVDPYPEHTKLRRIKAQREAVGDFLEWLEANGYRVCVERKADNEQAANVVHVNPEGRYAERLGDAFVSIINSIADSACVYWPTFERTEVLMAKHFEIDLRKLDDEKRAMLDNLRKAHEERSLNGAA